MNRDFGRDIERRSSRIGRNAHIAIRAERMIARRRLAVLRTQSGLLAFAGLVAGIGVIMLNVGAFFWLSTMYGNASAGLIVAVFNFALAVVLALFASRTNVEKELEPVIEVRDLAMEDIETEFAEGLTEARVLAENVRRIAQDPVSSLAPGLLAPVISMLIKSLKK